MREGDVNKVVQICQTVLDNYTQLDKTIVIGAIDTLADLIDWNELSIFEPTFNVITTLLEVKDYQQNALYCFYSFMHKGMEPGTKIKLIKEINIVSKIKNFEISADDFEFCQSISDIIKKLGFLVLEIVETAKNNEPYLEEAQSLLFELLLLNIMFLECDDVKSAQHIVKFVNAMVLYIRKLPELNEYLIDVVEKIQNI